MYVPVYFSDQSEVLCRQEVNSYSHFQALASQRVRLLLLLKLGTQKPRKQPLVLTV
jgi:hypothetical protein